MYFGIFLFLCFVFCDFCFLHRVSLYSAGWPGWPGTGYVEQDGPKLRGQSASIPQALGFKANPTIPAQTVTFWQSIKDTENFSEDKLSGEREQL